MTEAREHDLGVWHHWMDRQILFLKFCIPYQWVLLGVLACLMLLPVLWAVLAVLGVLLGKLSFGWLVGVLVYAAALALVLRGWAHFQEAVFPVWRWMVALRQRLHVRLGLSGYHPRGRRPVAGHLV